MTEPGVVEPGVRPRPARDPGPVPPPPAAARGPVVARLRRRWAAVPLVARLVAIITVLLAVGLVVAGVVATTLLSRTLVDQVDTKLVTEGRALARSSLAGFGNQDGALPTDYFVQLSEPGRTFVLSARERVLHEHGTPQIPELTTAQATAQAGVPFTVPSTEPGSDWRAVVYPVADEGDVVVAVALPLGDIQDTVQSMALVLVLSGLAIVLLGAVAGAWAVRRSLRPLRQIEVTAAAIAAGDLSRRVRTAPPSTEVGRLGEALNGMLAQIEQAFGARTASEARMRRFVADASHELRTPLAAIRGYGELYRMGALTTREQVDDTMGRIEGSATRMGGLVEDLLSLARLDESRPVTRAPVDLAVLAADAVSDLHAIDPARTTRIVPLVEGGSLGTCTVPADEARLRQVLANLVGNVVQHTPAGTPVEIAVGVVPAEGDAVAPAGVIEVRDHGPGIDPEHAARVFERFYRVDAARGRDSGGAGLGLAIVATIVETHGGAVSLRPTPGGGTTVRVTLPGVTGGGEEASGTDAGPLP